MPVFTITGASIPVVDFIAQAEADNLPGLFGQILAGDDQIIGADGGNVLFGFGGNDTITGGTDGFNRASYLFSPNGVNVSLAIDGVQATGEGNDTLINIQGVIGSLFDDVLMGDENGNVLDGMAGDDRIYGGAGYDTILGYEGDDYLDGGTDGDSMFGLEGNDTFIVDSPMDQATEFEGQGIDTVISSVSYTFFDTTSELENLTLVGSASINGSGNFLRNVIVGNGGANVLTGWGGQDQLSGNGGNDRLDGGLGVDRMYGGSGNDVYLIDSNADFTIEKAGEGVDTVESSVSHTLRANIEMLMLTGDVDLYGKGNALSNIITGNGGANKLYGLDGDDRLIGGSGNDLLDGGSGLDKAFGGVGDDVYLVDSSIDQVVELADEGYDTLQSAGSAALGANFERLDLTGAGNINGTGNSLNNFVIGNSGANVLRGGGGDDKLYGRDGADVVSGEDGADWLEGGSGRDRFIGGSGVDLFVFRNGDFAGLTTSTCDQIHDFSKADGDKIRLSLVDNSQAAGDQAFSFIATAAFSGSRASFVTSRSVAKPSCRATSTETPLLTFGFALMACTRSRLAISSFNGQRLHDVR